MTITGPAAGVTVSGGKLSRVLQVDAGVTASLSKLTLTGGSAGTGGGLSNAGTAKLTNCTVSGNSATSTSTAYGGGIYNSSGSTLTLTNCTVSGNSVSANSNSYGGGLINKGTMTLTNCTVSGNSAANGGGGLDNSGTATLTNCTVAGNSADDLDAGLDNSGTATLTNTIVAGNMTQFGSSNIGGNVSGKNNLIGLGDSGGLINGVNGNLVGVANALLAPLGNYGGPTPDHAAAARQPGHRRRHRRHGHPHDRSARRESGSVPSTSAPSRARASLSRPCLAARRRPRTSGRRSPTRSP